MRIGDFGKQEGYCLYAHLNLINDKVYIGISKDVDKRWEKREESYKGCNHIYHALKKYGWDSFLHVVLFDGMTLERACQKEKEWVRFFKDNKYSYNIADGGNGVPGVFDKGIKQVYCYDKKGNLIDVFPSIKQSIATLLNVPYKSCNGSVANVLYGRKASYKGYVWSFVPLSQSYFRQHFKGINRIERESLRDGSIVSYKGWEDVRKDYPDVRNICNCLEGKRKQSYGYKWRIFYEVD